MRRGTILNIRQRKSIKITKSVTINIFSTDESDTRADLVAVGLWTDISVRVLKLPSCEQLFVEMLGGGQWQV